jgi:glycosyltransferase involved in cell wall biosynthesis
MRLQMLQILAITKMSTPRSLSIADDKYTRVEFVNWVKPPYDLVMFVETAPYVRFHDLIDAPVIVDLENLESFKLSGQLATTKTIDIVSLLQVRGLLGMVKRLLDMWDVVRWRRLESALVRNAIAVFVCSELDRLRLDARNCFVIRNGYEPKLTVERNRHPHPATLTLIGLMTYEPNCDGALYFVNEILPTIRAEMPGVELRIVGHFNARFNQIADSPNVTVTGFVPDLTNELTRADVAVVPLRFGGGTRIKILEAFAYGIPVVSTSLGCEGLEAKDDKHLLIADDPQEFAAACLRLLRDPSERKRIGEGGHLLWKQKFRWTDIRRYIVEVVNAVINDKRSQSFDRTT